MRKRKSSGDPFDRILAALHRAALDEARWPEAERLIARMSRTRGNTWALAAGRPKPDDTVFQLRLYLDGRHRRDWERRYFEDYYDRDERTLRFLQLAPGAVTPTADLFTDAEKKTSVTYNELIVETKAQDGLNVLLESPRGPPLLWLVHDPVDRQGWSPAQIRLIKRLQPHVHQSAIVSHALAEAEVVGTSTAQLLASPRFGVIHLDRRGRIMTANDRALEILRQGDGLADRAGFLQARDPEEDAELSRLLARALPPFGMQGSAGSMMVTRPSPTSSSSSSSSSSSPPSPSSPPPAPFSLHVTPVGDEYPYFRTRSFGAIVLVVDSASPIYVDPAQVETALGLTPAESELAVALASGRTVREVAAASGRSDETVRWHVRQALRKVGVSRQLDLVRHVLSLEGFGTGSGDGK